MKAHNFVAVIVCGWDDLMMTCECVGDFTAKIMRLLVMLLFYSGLRFYSIQQNIVLEDRNIIKISSELQK